MINAAFIARSLQGKQSGQGWSARCPSHSDKKPSLSISERNGKVLFYCHAGCSQVDVIEALKSMGLWEDRQDKFQHQRKDSRESTPIQRQEKTRPEFTPEDKKRFALKIWEESVPSANTLVETYLSSLGLKLPLPPSLRFHPNLKHLPSGQNYPSMVALITHGIDGTPMAIQRTYLARDGKRKAPIDCNKMMLGPSRGGVIRLAEPDGFLMVGEGIETCLSAMMATGHPSWAAMSASGLAAINLPESVKCVIVLADGDKRGEEVALLCARRWTQQGKKVHIAHPPQGKDFNDLLIDNLSTNQRSKR